MQESHGAAHVELAPLGQLGGRLSLRISSNSASFRGSALGHWGCIWVSYWCITIITKCVPCCCLYCWATARGNVMAAWAAASTSTASTTTSESIDDRLRL